MVTRAQEVDESGVSHVAEYKAIPNLISIMRQVSYRKV